MNQRAVPPLLYLLTVASFALFLAAKVLGH
jgi:hypothetical protein